MNSESPEPNRRKVRVLVADDSAVMRSVLLSILESQPRIEVAGTARNGKEALAAFQQLRPDLVLLDIEMPEMDGLEVLSQIRKQDRSVPVIMCSTLTQSGVQITLEALARGATDYVPKLGGRSIMSQEEASMEQQLVPKIMALFPEHPAVRIAPEALPIHVPPLAHHPTAQGLEIVVIGVSTGGPAALETLLTQIPSQFPLPILIVQHMPQRFTEQLAHRLDDLCPLRVREATDGDRPEPGIINIARGNWHLELTRDFRMHLHQREPECFCRPSADVLFRSAAIACSGKLLGVVLTGMGSDGLEGCRAIRAAGGSVFAQDAASSVVWGMPGSVVNAGLANKVIALNSMASEIARFVSTALRKSA